MKTQTLAFAALAAAILSASAAPALAAESPKQGVLANYADLDLGTAAGRATLNQRYDQAAREKCGVVDGQKPNAKARYCYKATAEQYRHFAAAILAQHDRTEGQKSYGLAAR